MDFTKYIFDVEYQNANGVEKLNCVASSFINCIQTLYYYQFGVKRQFSKRHLAQLSGTTHYGNSLEQVFQTVLKFGLVDEELYPDDATTWEEYYKDVPQDVINEGKEFLNYYNFDRKYLNNSEATLDNLPLQVTVLYASGNGILNPSSNPPNIFNHAVEVYNKTSEYYGIFDSEPQAFKKYISSYKFGTILKPSLIRKTMSNVKLVKDQNSTAVGFFVPAVNPSALISMGLNFDKEIPTTSTGNVDWDNVKIEGSVNFK